MNSRTLISAVAILLAMQGMAARAENPAPLHHNPFSRPSSETIPDARPQVTANGPVGRPNLRATMVGAQDRLANVAGRTLRPGDHVDGYVLLQVFEDRAVFLHNGERLTVYVKPERTENDE